MLRGHCFTISHPAGNRQTRAGLPGQHHRALCLVLPMMYAPVPVCRRCKGHVGVPYLRDHASHTYVTMRPIPT
eukprot:365584-Chlamydomonas_euryale.AAC.25